MSQFPIIDPHMHLWDLDKLTYPWLLPPFDEEAAIGSLSLIAKTYLIDDYQRDAAGWDVRGTVHIEAGASDALAETDWLQELANNGEIVRGIVAAASLNAPNIEPLLAAHAERKNVKGIRQVIHWHSNPKISTVPNDITTSEAWKAGFSHLSKYNLRFDLHAYPSQFMHLSQLFKHHPDIPVIINHTGLGIPSDANWKDVWREGMRALADLPHVSLKIAGLGFLWNPWTIDQIRDYVLEAIDIFGTSRTMFSSNFPTDKLFDSFDRHYKAYDLLTKNFSETDRSKLFAENANKIYDLGIEL